MCLNKPGINKGTNSKLLGHLFRSEVELFNRLVEQHATSSRNSFCILSGILGGAKRPLIGKDLRGINFGYTILEELTFENCGLEDACFSGARLVGVEFNKCDLSNATFSPKFRGTIRLIPPVLRHVLFIETTLTNVDFTGAMINGVNFLKCIELNPALIHTELGADESAQIVHSCFEHEDHRQRATDGGIKISLSPKYKHAAGCNMIQ